MAVEERGLLAHARPEEGRLSKAHTKGVHADMMELLFTAIIGFAILGLVTAIRAIWDEMADFRRLTEEEEE